MTPQDVINVLNCFEGAPLKLRVEARKIAIEAVKKVYNIPTQDIKVEVSTAEQPQLKERGPIKMSGSETMHIDCSREKGHWDKVIGTIVDRRRCSKCKAVLAWNIPYDNFCSNCGADMRKEKENERPVNE